MKQKFLNIFYIILWFFAKIYIKRTKPQIIGITGSVGKTSSRMIIFQVLQKFFPEKNIYTSPKNFNSELGLVFSVFGVEKYSPSVKNLLQLFFVLGFRSVFGKKKCDILVLEYGVDKPWDMDFLLKIAAPDYAVFTKLDYIHAANFDSQEGIWEEKMKLLQAANIRFLNGQDEFQKKYAQKLWENTYFYNEKNIEFSFEQKDETIFVSFENENQRITTNMLGSENFVYINLALEIVKMLDETQEKKLQENIFLELQNLAGRFSIFDGKYESIIIDSSYNSGIESMKKMIDNTCDLQKKLFPERKIIFVLGEMRELGEVSEKLHKELYEYAKPFGKIISVWTDTKAYFWPHLGNFRSSRDAWKLLQKYLAEQQEKYLVLFKGSQNTIFLEEAIKEVLQDKTDEKNLVRQETYWMETKEKFFNEK